MASKIVISMTREEALRAGLLTCANCGWPVNNHFDFGPNNRPCAHDSKCKNYKETAKVGRLIKGKKK